MENILSTFEKVAKNERITINALEKKIGASKGVLSRAIAQKSDISSKWLLRLVENYPLYNPAWMLTGEGPMLRDQAGKVHEPAAVWKVKGDRGRQTQLIPLYDVVATAGIVELLHHNKRKHIPIDYISIPNLPKCDGALPITGDSMYPLLKSGDIALYKEVRDFANNIIWGEMYLVAISHNGDDFFFAKYLQRSEKEGWVKLVSQNKHHQDKEFPIQSITALALIKASIRINTGF